MINMLYLIFFRRWSRDLVHQMLKPDCLWAMALREVEVAVWDEEVALEDGDNKMDHQHLKVRMFKQSLYPMYLTSW